MAASAENEMLSSSPVEIVSSSATEVTAHALGKRTETHHMLTENGETVEVVTVTLDSEHPADTQLQTIEIDQQPRQQQTATTATTQQEGAHQLMDVQNVIISDGAGGDVEVEVQQFVKTTAANNELVVSTTPSATEEENVQQVVYITEHSGPSSSYPPEKTCVTTEVNTWDESECEQYSACLICNDRGSGFHYSVFSCEGCKGFFKRSVQKNLTYTCKNEGTCDINKYSRNNCQYCRFKKCLQFGMKKEGVGGTQGGRAPGATRQKRMRVEPATPESLSDLEVEAVVQGLVDIDPFTAPSFIPPDSTETTITIDDVKQLMKIAYEDLRYIIQWAKRLPAFGELQLSDQMVLLKSAFMELSVLRLAYRSLVVEEDHIQFAEDLCVSGDDAIQLGFDEELVSSTLDITKRLRNLQIDQKEYAVLCVLVLLHPDAMDLGDVDKVNQLQQKYLDILRRYIKTVYSDAIRRYGRMLLRLPALRTISMKASEVYVKLALQDKLEIPELVAEMLADV